MLSQILGSVTYLGDEIEHRNMLFRYFWSNFWTLLI